MDKLGQLNMLRREITSKMYSGIAKDFIDSIWECEYEVDWDAVLGTVSIGDQSEDGWAVIYFDLGSGEPLSIEGDKIVGGYNIITEMIRLEAPLWNLDFLDGWEIHTEEGHIYMAVDYLEYDYLNTEAHSMVLKKV